MAAKELDRSFVGAELERGYAELAARRIAATERGGVLRELSGSAVVALSGDGGPPARR